MEKKIINGFEFVRSRGIPEISATLHEGRHIKSGASLAYLEREDSNKTFAIAFKTIPEDSTGVFHILEHSVLCGSRKYPVKEPFVELLKSSLKTFLNAFTFPDKTMYPVSSRNQKDFLNLVDVYMDAVLYPRAISDPNVFYQEGWHYEVEESGELSYKGVVFNEMKGAYSSADEVEMSEMSKLLYKGSCYAKDSGGSPKVIPTLTFEEFKAAHEKYYHPSNARIFLDGKIELEETLSLLDSYLCDYDAKDVHAPIEDIKKETGRFAKVDYEIPEGEDASGKARLVFGFYSHACHEIEKSVALSVITDAIAGSNEAPFKKVLLDSGLCEDVTFIPYDGIRENCLLLELKNLNENDWERVRDLVFHTLQDIVAKGIDKEALTAAFNSLEFKVREQDGGYYPAGISYSIAALGTWLYDEDPIIGLRFEETVATLKAALDTDYYERLLEDTLINSPHSATLLMLPSKELGRKNAEEESAALAFAKDKMGDEGLLEIRALCENLTSHQTAPDSEEALATLPYLTLEDINPEPEEIPVEDSTEEGVRVIFTPTESRGITYLSLLFDISDLTEKELFFASVITDILTNIRTKNNSAIALQNRLKSNLGSVSFSTFSVSHSGIPTPYFKLSSSFLDSKCEVAVELIKEITMLSDLSDGETISKLLKQIKSSAYEGICASGHSSAIGRAAAYTSCEAAISEYTEGIEFYRALKALDSSFEEKREEFLEDLQSLYRRIFTRERLTVSYSGKSCPELPKKFIRIFPITGEAPSECKIKPLGKRNEGFVIPAGVSFAALCGTVNEAREQEFSGTLSVVRSILSYGYLWNKIRVEGGAYGSGLVCRRSGLVGFYSYRDPNAARSLELYGGSSDYLRALANSGEDLTGFIIGAVGESDPLLTPKTTGALGMLLALRGESHCDRVKKREQMLSTGKTALIAAADLIDDVCREGAFCIIGGKEKLEGAKSKLKEISEL